MPWSTSNRFVQSAAHFFFQGRIFFSRLRLEKKLNIIEEYEGLSLVDEDFAPRDAVKKETGHVTLFHECNPMRDKN